MTASASHSATTPLRPTPDLGMPGVDLPLPDGSRVHTPPPAPPAETFDLRAGVQDDPPKVSFGRPCAQQRVRCKEVIDALKWGPDTVLVAHVDQHLPTAWLQAQPPPCPHADCRHDHQPPALPGATERHRDDERRSRATVTVDKTGPRLRIPAGLCHWVGSQGEVLLIARPELEAVELTSAAAVAQILNALRPRPATTPDNVTPITTRRNLA